MGHLRTASLLIQRPAQTRILFRPNPRRGNTDLVRQNVSSYRDLPFSWYQIQDKFRNEIRATGGLLRTREFLMKDLYSFHATGEDFDNFYEKVSDTGFPYGKCFHTGLSYEKVFSYWIPL